MFFSFFGTFQLSNNCSKSMEYNLKKGSSNYPLLYYQESNLSSKQKKNKTNLNYFFI